MSETSPTYDDQPVRPIREDDVKWLALLIRQGLKLIVVGIERHYGLQERDKRAA